MQNGHIEFKMTIRNRASVFVVHDNHVLGFYAEDPVSRRRYFFPPGGLIEPGESPAEAVVRETLEETGFSIQVVPGLQCRRRYDFEWNGNIYDCRTHFFLGNLIHDKPAPVADADYHRGVGWVHVSEVAEVFAYSDAILASFQQLVASV